MESLERQKSSVTFTNEPTLSDQKADEHFNERRTSLVKHIHEFVSNHEFFKDTEVRITFATKGISSLVSIIETSDKKMVLKIPLSTTHAVGESQFLLEWAKAGVQVPHVIETGSVDDHQYMLMEYIDALALEDAYSMEQLIEKKVFVDMGETMRKMHTPIGEGFGLVVDGHGQYPSFREWINGSDMQRRVAYVNEHNLLGDSYGTFDVVSRILTEFVDVDPQSTFCHDDFDLQNIFATEPITVFDPNPRFNHRYIDVGRAIMKQISHNRPREVVEQLKRGYFGNELPNEKALHASIVLACYMRFPYWNRIREKRGHLIEKAQKYLEENKHLLE